MGEVHSMKLDAFRAGFVWLVLLPFQPVKCWICCLRCGGIDPLDSRGTCVKAGGKPGGCMICDMTNYGAELRTVSKDYVCGVVCF